MLVLLTDNSSNNVLRRRRMRQQRGKVVKGSPLLEGVAMAVLQGLVP